MKTPAHPQHSRLSPLLKSILTVMTLLVLILNYFIYSSLKEERIQTEERALQITRNLSQVLSIYVESAIHRIDVILLNLAQEINDKKIYNNKNNAQLSQLILRQSKNLTDTNGLRFANAEGKIIYGAKEEIGKKIFLKEEDSFSEIKNNNTNQLYISQPFIGPVLGDWAIILARKVETPSGQFIGIVYAPIRLDFFTKIFSKISLEKDSIINLHDQHFDTRVNYPGEIREETVNQTFPRNEIYEKFKKGDFEGKSIITLPNDGIKRFFSFKKLVSFPLYISSGIPYDAHMGNWRDGHLKSIAILIVLNFLTIIMIIFFLRRGNIELKLQEEIFIAKEKAEQASLAKTKFVSNTSHEIRTPLNAMIGFIDLLYETPLNEDQKNYLKKMNTAAENLLDLINSTLELSRIESGQLLLETSSFHLKEMLAGTIELLKVNAEKKKIRLDFELDTELESLVVETDKIKLRQILVNLIGNSIKFTDIGSVNLKLKKIILPNMTEALYFQIKDTGIGIPKNKQDKLFRPFIQIDNASNQRLEGSGLGLSICKMLIDFLKGTIWITSTEGEGSIFHFQIPLTVKEKSVSDVSSKEKKMTNHKNILEEKKSILLVDDSDDNKNLILLFLKKYALTIDLASNGREAYELFMKKKYDLVFMDMMMPVMDGFESTRLIREFEKKNNQSPIPIIALTAYGLNEEKDKCITAGCTKHLLKPVHKAAIVAEVEVILTSRT